MRTIGYNSQKNNIKVAGIGAFEQCFATTALMFLSYFSPMYRADDDQMLKTYVAEITNNGANPEKEFLWEAHRQQVQKWLDLAGVKKKIVYEIGTITPARLIEILKTSPCFIGTKQMANLPSGHIILGVDNNDGGGIVVNDPFGDALTFYANPNGADLVYPYTIFMKDKPEGGFNIMWAEDIV